MALDTYLASKLGPMNQAAYNGSAGATVRFSLTPPNPGQRALYMLRSTTNVRILQGGAAVDVSATTGTLLQANVYMPMVVEGTRDMYISLLSGTTAAGTLDITLASDVASWTLASA